MSKKAVVGPIQSTAGAVPARNEKGAKSDGCSPLPVGLRIVVGDLVEKRIARQREQHDVLSSSDLNTPIDMSMKKVKRKLTSSDLNDEASSDEKERDDKIKRNRSSVISFACRHRMMSNVTGFFDVDDHFKKSLGLELYNSIFSGDKKKSPITPTSRSSVPTATTPEEVHLEQKKKIFKPKLMASHAKVIKSVSHAPDLDDSVDDHFAKALGKSTWMRLQQGL